MIHTLPGSYGAVIAVRFRTIKMLSASGHRNVRSDNNFVSTSLVVKPIMRWKEVKSHRGELECRISVVGSFLSSPIYEVHSLKYTNHLMLLFKGGIVRGLSASRPDEGLRRGFKWSTSVVNRGLLEQTSRNGASATRDPGHHSASFSLCDENSVCGDGERHDVELSKNEGEPGDGEVQSGDGNYRLWNVKPKTKEELKSGLYLVGTPIGNLEDITLRALRVLQSATCILAEDTRHSSKLLQHYGISTPTMSYHKFNEFARRRELIQRLQRGEVLALISDAGMPGISDPGSELVKACVEENVKVFPVPGPCAALSALVASGLATEGFSFVGFLPAQASSRRKRLSAAANEPGTQIFYVPPHKLCRVLDDFISTFGATRRCVIAREMTKLHEEFWRSTLEEAKVEFEERQPRGELTLIVEGLLEGVGVHQATKEELTSRLEILMETGKGPSEASKLVVEETSARRNIVYSLALEISKRSK